MLDSGLKMNELITQLKSELDIAIPFSDDTYIRLANEVLQLLYTEIIREENAVVIQNIADNKIILSDIAIPDNQREIQFENVTKVYVNNELLSKSAISNIDIFPNIYYREIGNCLGFDTTKADAYSVKLFYCISPALFTKDNIVLFNVPIPYEWLPLITSKVKGEIFKMVNEDDISAKWLNDYNNLIEAFKAWCNKHYLSYLGW